MSENKKKNAVRNKESKCIDVAGKLSQFIEKKRIQNEALKKIADEFSSNKENKNNN